MRPVSLSSSFPRKYAKMDEKDLQIDLVALKSLRSRIISHQSAPPDRRLALPTAEDYPIMMEKAQQSYERSKVRTMSSQRQVVMRAFRDVPTPVFLPYLGAIWHSPFQAAFEAPRQPGIDHALGLASIARVSAAQAAEVASWLHSGPVRALVMFHFDRNRDWRAAVFPPASLVRRGLLATRSPHRPNPIGLSAVRVAAVCGPCDPLPAQINVERPACPENMADIVIIDGDLLLGTPILGIRLGPLEHEVHPDAASGFRQEAALPLYTDEVAETENRFVVEYADDHIAEAVAEAALLYPSAPPAHVLERTLGRNPLLQHRHRLTSKIKTDEGLFVANVGAFEAGYLVFDNNGMEVETAAAAANTHGVVKIMRFITRRDQNVSSALQSWKQKYMQ